MTPLARWDALMQLLDRWGAPVLPLLIRLVIAKIFFFSGLVKLDAWSLTVALFADEYRVPLLPPALAAFMAAAVELTVAPLLAIGLASRFAALALLGMTAVIQFTYLDSMEHLYWALLLSVIIILGPGSLSVDARIRPHLRRLLGE